MHADGTCRGCKLGYETGERDLGKAKCAMKVCCLKKEYNTCADCPEYKVCEILQTFYEKKSWKYRKYRQATEYIRAHDYDNFLRIADGWNGACGKYE
jgi:hypothetical protein